MSYQGKNSEVTKLPQPNLGGHYLEIINSFLGWICKSFENIETENNIHCALNMDKE